MYTCSTPAHGSAAILRAKTPLEYSFHPGHFSALFILLNGSWFECCVCCVSPPECGLPRAAEAPDADFRRSALHTRLIAEELFAASSNSWLQMQLSAFVEAGLFCFSATEPKLALAFPELLCHALVHAEISQLHQTPRPLSLD